MQIIQELKLPKQPISIQITNKSIWNNSRLKENADFFTTGYERRALNTLISIFSSNEVSTLIDIRFNPVSFYRPEFSKCNLNNALNNIGIEYIHRPDLGIPRDIRGKAVDKGTRNYLWLWYAEFILPNYIDNLDNFFNNANHPVVFMCMEYDPTTCHRHRLALALEGKGLRSYDL
jgi:uncharacterized protein (DUF488 family)